MLYAFNPLENKLLFYPRGFEDGTWQLQWSYSSNPDMRITVLETHRVGSCGVDVSHKVFWSYYELELHMVSMQQAYIKALKKANA